MPIKKQFVYCFNIIENIDMEIVSNEPKKVSFNGNGGNLFGIMVVNFLLGIVTLGLYYPWARARKLQYMYSETEFDKSTFTFHGTGKEMFVGFIKAVGIFIVLYGLIIAAAMSGNPMLAAFGPLVMVMFILVLSPIAIHGSMRYRTSRTSWRGIHFGYRGERGVLVKKFVLGTLLSIVTLYIYLAWFIIDVRKYIIDNIRFGSVSFKYNGTGADYFLLNLKGFFLTLLTFGIYSFWWFKNSYNYYVENIVIVHNNKEHSIQSTATAGEIFKLVFISYLIIIVTLGIATPWVIVRNIKFVYDNALIDGSFDTNNIQQTEENYTDATGDDLTSMLDINIV